MPFASTRTKNCTFGVGRFEVLMSVLKVAEAFTAMFCVTVTDALLDTVTFSGVSVAVTVTEIGDNEFEVNVK